MTERTKDEPPKPTPKPTHDGVRKREDRVPLGEDSKHIPSRVSDTVKPPPKKGGS